MQAHSRAAAQARLAIVTSCAKQLSAARCTTQHLPKPLGIAPVAAPILSMPANLGQKECRQPNKGRNREAAPLAPTLSMPTAWDPWPGKRKAMGVAGTTGLAGAAAAAAAAASLACAHEGGGRAGQPAECTAFCVMPARRM